jgi:hypothetical protein
MARPHLVTFQRQFVINSSRHGRLSGAKCDSGQRQETAMKDSQPNCPEVSEETSREISRANHPQFASAQGERWRRFLERVGTRSNDFAARLSRARFVYLHRRETSTHWLPL